MMEESEQGPSTDELPTEIAGYRLLDRLGEGGMGVVYRAREQSSGELVAVKTVRGIDEKELSAIRREIQTLSSLDHPAVVRIRDHGVIRRRPWYAMDLLDGQTYEGLLDECWGADDGSASSTEAATAWDHNAALTPTSVQPARPPSGSGASTGVSAGSLQEFRTEASNGQLGRLLRPLAEISVAISYLHGRGVVHRDLKPDNLFLSDEAAVVGDFGVAYRSRRGMGREVLEVSGRAGTIGYMSPEQIRGSGLDARSDLYSLGCMIYRALVGRTPFVGDHQSVVTGHLKEAPTAPSELVWGVPSSLEELVLSLLSKEPTARPGYSRDVATELWKHVPGGMPHDLDYGDSYLYRPRLTGRAGLVKQLKGAFTHNSSQRCRLAVVSGPSGIGKTALLSEVASEVGAGGVEVIAESSFGDLPVDGSATSASPFEPLGPLLRQIADHCASCPPREARRIVGKHGALLAELEPVFGELADDSSFDVSQLPAEGRQRLQLEALARSLQAYARDRQLLVVLDDLHWSDEVTLKLLAALAENRYDAGGCMVLAGARAEQAPEQLRELMEIESVTLHELQPLDSSSVLSLIREMLAAEELPEELARAISDRSDGSPYFVIEYLGALLRSGSFGRDADGRWSWLDTGSSSELLRGDPPSLRELVRQRLALVSPEARPLLELAAVLGRELDGELLEDVAKTRGETFLSSVAELMQLSILEELSAGRIRFVHDQLRVAAYEELDAERRAALHRSVAERLELRGDEDPSTAHVLGDHWFAAGHTDKALPNWELAGRAAMDQFASRKAIALFGTLLEHCPEDADPLRTADWRLQLARAYLSRGEHDECVASARSALELLGFPLPASTFGWLRSGVAEISKQLLRRRGLLPIRAVPNESERVRFQQADQCLRLAAQSFYWRNQILPILSSAFRSLNIAERLGPSADLMLSYAMAAGTSQMFRLRRLTERYLEMASEAGRSAEDPVRYAEALNAMGIVRAGMGHWSTAREHLAEGERRYRDLGYHVWWEVTAMSLATVEDFVGETSRALGRYAEAYESALRGNTQTQVWALLGALRCHLLEGNLDRSAECIELLEQLSDDAQVLEGPAAAWKSYLYMLRRDWTASAELLRSVSAGWDVRSATYSAYSFLAAALEICLRLHSHGDASSKELAEPHLKEIVDLLTTYSKTFPIGSAAALRGQGHIAVRQGKREKAATLWQQSLEQATALEQPAEIARAHFDLAGARTHSQAAAEHARQAAETFSRLGFRPEHAWAEELRAGL